MRLGAAISVLLGVSLASSTPLHRADASDWKEHRHHLSLLVAGTSEDDEDAFTLGADYEYRLNERIEIGTVAEYAFGDIDTLTLLGVVNVRAWRGLVIQTGPGVAFVSGDSDDLVYRIGTFYGFEFGRVTVSPQVHYDVTTGENAIVYGVGVGFGF